MTATVAPGIAELTDLARESLILASERLSGSEGVPGTRAEGQLIRPLVALAGLGGRTPSPRFWDAVLAIQLAHEASLLHDDVIDGATTRRGRPTLSAERGIARALLAGDHLLTAAYRAAAETGSLPFVTRFARSVERTVAGEAAQGRASGRILQRPEYEEIVLAKSGELLGCALAAAATLDGDSDADQVFELGRRVGLLYQMLDDLLDYCPLANTGKTPLGDYETRRWTWVLEEFPGISFGLPRDLLLGAMFAEPAGVAGVARCRERLVMETERLLRDLRTMIPGDLILSTLLRQWLDRASSAVDAELASRAETAGPPAGRSVPRRPGVAVSSAPTSARDHLRILAARVPAPGDTSTFFGRNSRSFRFASRFFGTQDGPRIARVYAFCRVTDDLADRPEDNDAEALLDSWLGVSASAYSGRPSGIPLVDDTMVEMAEAGAPFEYVEELVEGMRMDLRGVRYARLDELGIYTYRVASVVGLWITRLAGCSQPWLLGEAARMGGAMQMTNILRDVGEDLRIGRLYLPAECLDRHNLTEDDLRASLGGGPLPAGYGHLIEELLIRTENEYQMAFAAVPALPAPFARSFAVAALVYRGIHREIRRSGYDNLRRRARTGPLTKAVLAGLALWKLQSATTRLRTGNTSPAPAWAGNEP